MKLEPQHGPTVLVAAALFAVTMLQLPLVREDVLLTRDDQRLVSPLASLHEPGEWVDAVRDGRVLDVQPVRDASFALNLALLRSTGKAGFHLFNLLIWFGVVLLAWRVFLGVGASAWLAAALASLLCLHPALMVSVGWVAARKHLLSCFFALCATRLLQRALTRQATAADVLGIVTCFTLSVLAQPISVGWPVWAAFEVWRHRAGRFSFVQLVLPSGLVAGAVAALNAAYYGGAYATATQHEKFTGGANPGVSLLALGRGFFNLVCPIALATTYDPGRVFNLVGLGLLVVFAAWVWFRKPGSVAVGWALFALLPLAVVLARITAAFVFDTYLLLPAVGLGALLAVLLKESELPSAGGLLGLGLAVFFGYEATRVVQSLRSDDALWAHSFEVEPTQMARVRHAFYLAGTARAEEAVQLALELQADVPRAAEADMLLARTVSQDRSMTAAQRVSVLEAFPSNDPWHRYVLGMSLTSVGQQARGTEMIWLALQEPSAFRDQLGAVAAEGFALCQRSGAADCIAKLEAVRAKSPSWPKGAFSKRCLELGLNPPE